MPDVFAKVLRFPGARRVGDALGGPVRQLLPPYAVDDWGRDPDFVRRAQRLAHLRWSVSIDGHQHLPRRSGGLLVASARRFSLSAVFAALALGEVVERPVRFVGRPDIAPLGDLMRRMGALLARPDEIEGALRHGELVLITTRPTGNARHAGTIDHALVAPAVRSGMPLFPVATLSSPASRAARVHVGPAVRPNRRRRGPLAEVELAEAAQRNVQRLLDGLGLMPSGLPAADLISRN